MSDKPKLIVGLGNPGDKYAKTRHNIGFWFVEALAQQQGASFRSEAKFFGSVAKMGNVYLLKPSTFMNRSGQAVAALARFYKITPEQIVLVHDELDLPCGIARLKKGGGHGGHNGLRDTISQLGGSREFLRLRLGIDHPGNKNQVSDYVLKPPRAEQAADMDSAINAALDVFPDVLDGQLQAAMLKLHS